MEKIKKNKRVMWILLAVVLLFGLGAGVETSSLRVGVGTGVGVAAGLGVVWAMVRFLNEVESQPARGWGALVALVLLALAQTLELAGREGVGLLLRPALGLLCVIMLLKLVPLGIKKHKEAGNG